MKYTLTMFGKQYELNGVAVRLVFWSLFLIAGFFVWSVCGGLYKYGGAWLVVAYIVLFLEVTVNGVRHSLLPKALHNIIGLPISIVAIIYYWY